jgi:RNA polymerase sigma-70 factor (ECF subfamily)
MDELTLLRRVRAEVDEPSEAAIDAGRAQLEAMWTGDAARRPRVRVPRRRPVWRRAGWTAGGVAVAAGLAGVLVLTNVVGLPGGRGGASPAAASVLNSAAAIAARTSDPALKPGQYLEVDTTAVGSTGTSDGHGGTVSFLTITEEQLYIPSDRSNDWVWIRPMSKPYRTFGPASAAAADKWYAEATKQNGDYVERLRAPGGNFYSYPSEESDAELAKLPKDPGKLLDYIYSKTGGHGSSRGHEAFVWLADRLTTGAVPAAYRAEFYRTAALIPGVVVSDKAANLDGRVGTAIGYHRAGAVSRDDIIIDPDTGAYIGQREIMLKADGGLPAGEVAGYSAVRTAVVDSAPAGGSVNGYDDDHHCVLVSPGQFQCPQS